jgi:Dynamin family
MTSEDIIEKETDTDMSATPPQIPVNPEIVTTTSLESLQSDGQRKIMDIVDKLRRTGLNGVVQLPQLVVCGDQSSGKSSVLEAITEIPFPRKENLCTRFATEIVLRRDHTPSISTKITPDKARPAPEQAKLREFSKSINDFSELPALMDEATSLMGLGEVGQGNSRAFSRDVLSIEICGPGRPQL